MGVSTYMERTQRNTHERRQRRVALERLGNEADSLGANLVELEARCGKDGEDGISAMGRTHAA